MKDMMNASPYSTLLKPRALKKGDTIGIFTPSWPAHVILRDKYQHALRELKRVGFDYIQGSLTAKMQSQGFRTASAKERADELMELVKNDSVHCIMATIGGSNSASLIPYLDFDRIRNSRKLICGYSDITSLHLAILKYSNLSTIYGPSLIPIFGEYPLTLDYALDSFLNLVCNTNNEVRDINPPDQYSTHFIDALNQGWEKEKRHYVFNEGWRVLCEGESKGPLIVADLETLVAAAGTPHFPNFDGAILLLEEMDAPFSKEERNFRQLEQIGVFNSIAGLIISKPFNPDSEGAPFSYEDLIMEIIPRKDYPIISNFDCGHTFPSMSLALGLKVEMHAIDRTVKFRLLESAVL